MSMADDISECYDELMTAPDDYERVSKFDRMADRALVDKHYISYMDYDMYWCRRWKRNRKWDGMEEQ